MVALSLLMPTMAWADEGMWLLSLVGKNYNDMQRAGFKLMPEDVYSINQGCLKDAIVGLGNAGSPFWHFCTGEIISTQGLVSTNHHCGYGQLQKHSTVEHDYLRDGFWAYSKDQELPNPGLTASILVRMEDVTDQVKATLNDDMSEADREAAIKQVGEEIASKAVEGTQYDAKVIPMFNGNQFFLFVHIIYKDVRLVGAPPSSMGKFGGDTDNWSWPRHTCDFSMFRIYTAPDGSPAEYSEDNVPLVPKYHLRVSAGELNDGDYAMVMGFPGSTDRFLTSYGLEETIDITNKLRHEIRTVKINILRERMAADQATRIKYASKYASCSNYWKYSGEQNKALVALNTMGVKQDIEREYTDWARGHAPKYSRALELIKEGYAARRESQSAMMYVLEGLLTGPEALLFSCRLGNSFLRTMGDAKDDDLSRFEGYAANYFKDYDAEVDRQLAAALFAYVYEHINPMQCPAFLREAHKKYKGNWDKYVAELYGKSIFASEEALTKFMQKPNRKQVERDPLFKAGSAAMEAYQALYKATPQATRDNLERGIRDFTDGILQINAGQKFLAPDANSTIRFTYGNVKSYDPRDGVTYKHYTTMKGVIEKEDSTSTEFYVPDRLKRLYADGRFGSYADKNGQLPTCFITNNDITGGNSGSPVINANGHLIGLAFDGNGEAMSGDIDFEENLQRCICLDSRYMLWVIDVYAGAHNLIEEIDIVR